MITCTVHVKEQVLFPAEAGRFKETFSPRPGMSFTFQGEETESPSVWKSRARVLFEERHGGQYDVRSVGLMGRTDIALICAAKGLIPQAVQVPGQVYRGPAQR